MTYRLQFANKRLIKFSKQTAWLTVTILITTSVTVGIYWLQEIRVNKVKQELENVQNWLETEKVVNSRLKSEIDYLNSLRKIDDQGYRNNPTQIEEYWKTSLEHFVIKIPEEWYVWQTDRHAGSEVSISSKYLQDNPDIAILIEGADYEFDPAYTDFNSWVINGGSRTNTNKPKVLSSTQISLGGLPAIYQLENDIVSSYYVSLTLDLDVDLRKLYIKVSFRTDNPKVSIIERIINTINFKPPTKLLESARVIP